MDRQPDFRLVKLSSPQAYFSLKSLSEDNRTPRRRNALAITETAPRQCQVTSLLAYSNIPEKNLQAHHPTAFLEVVSVANEKGGFSLTRWSLPGLRYMILGTVLVSSLAAFGDDQFPVE